VAIQDSSSSPILSISLFGRFEARLDTVPLGGFDYNKVRALLAYLAIEHKQPHTRAALCALLWPDLGENAARQNLSQALTRLRQVLGDKQAHVPFLLSTTDTVQLNPVASLAVDVNTFSTLITTAERHPHRGWHLCTSCAIKLQAAVRWYQGDFLAHFYLSDSDPFEEWALPLRQRLRSRMLSALERLVRYAEWRGDFTQAIEIAHQQIGLEPFRDDAHREMMRLLALSGQHRAALLHYENFCQLLESELGAAPEPETITLYEQILSDPIHEHLRHTISPPSSIPAAPTALVGRERDVQSVCDQLTGGAQTPPARLLTITGAPGMGKTRLALEIAQRLRFDFEEGVHWIELAPVLEAERVPAAVADALEIKEHPRRTLETMVAEQLAPQHRLLILDNFEHLLDAASFVAMLLRACPTLSILITSRAPLHLRAEVQYSLEPLGLPAADATPDITANTEAVQLFAHRARAIHPEWYLTAETIPAVAALCRRMDGLPLAIELIAPRLKSLSATEILQQFESPLNAAPPGPRDMPARHRTLRNAIQWSYGRLTKDEQMVFTHLGLFPSGGTVESTQAVVGNSVSVMPLLESLHDTSLLHTRRDHGNTRFYQLETIREFAGEQLATNGEAEIATERFIAYFVQLANEAYVQLLGSEQATWSTRLAAEQDNIRAALRRALDTHRIEAILRIATGTWRFWWQRGNLREALGWLETGLAEPEQAPPLVRTRALRAAGVLAMGLSEYGQARRLLEEAAEVALHANAIYDHGSARTNLGMVLREQGDFKAACAYLEQSAALMRTLEDPRLVKFPLIILASLYVRMGKIDQAAALYDECLWLNRDLGDTEGTANALYGIGSIHHARGDYEQARHWCEQGFILYQTLNHQFGAGWCCGLLGNIAYKEGDYEGALAAFRQALTIWMQRGDHVNGARTLEDIAKVMLRMEEPERATRLMAAAIVVYENTEVRLTEPEQVEHDIILAQCRMALGEKDFMAGWQEGRGMTVMEAVAMAMHPSLP
jgi:predicted ATPase/DNA-binding SARP family transcriptional activator